MKKTICSIIFIILIISFTKAQWVQMSNGMGNTQNVSCFITIGNYLFAGASNGVYLSTNYGTNWVQVSNGLPNNFIYDLEVNGTNVFASTPNFGVYISTNNGGNWTQVNNGIPDMQVLTLAANSTYIFAGTYNSGTGLYRSSNNGLNWINCLNTYRTYGLYTTGNNVFVGTHYSGAFRSTNNGDNFTQINNGLPYVMTFCFVYNGVNLFAGTRPNGIYRSSNLGDSWTQVNSGLTHDTIVTLESSGINLFAGAAPGGVFFSTNNGSNWVEKNEGLGINPSISRIYVINNYIFAAISGQSVWRRPLSDLVGFHNTGNEIPSSFSLSQNYPNPFNPTTKIRFSLPSPSEGGIQAVKLVILDVLGREVTALVNEQLQPGTYEVDWDGSSFATGVYFYELITESYTETKKMILIK